MHACWVLVLAILFGFRVVANEAEDDRLYNRIGVLKGTVTIVNHPELGRTPASGDYFLLQRLDCRKCVIGIHTDIDGRYNVAVAVGRYRVISTQGVREGEGRSRIRPGHPHVVEVKPPPTDTVLDIELVVSRPQ